MALSEVARPEGREPRARRPRANRKLPGGEPMESNPKQIERLARPWIDLAYPRPQAEREAREDQRVAATWRAQGMTNRDVPSKADAQAVLDTFRAAIRDYMRAGIQRDALLTRLRAGQKAQQATAQPLTFSAFADVYLDRYVKANGLKSVATIECRMATIKAHFGDRALTDI